LDLTELYETVLSHSDELELRQILIDALLELLETQ
jgi:hypothetical protein